MTAGFFGGEWCWINPIQRTDGNQAPPLFPLAGLSLPSVVERQKKVLKVFQYQPSFVYKWYICILYQANNTKNTIIIIITVIDVFNNQLIICVQV